MLCMALSNKCATRTWGSGGTLRHMGLHFYLLNRCASISLLIAGNSIKIIKIGDITSFKMTRNIISQTKTVTVNIVSEAAQELLITCIIMRIIDRRAARCASCVSSLRKKHSCAIVHCGSKSQNWGRGVIYLTCPSPHNTR